MTNCLFGGVEYSEGATVCSGGKELKCYGGVWTATGNSCVETAPELPDAQADANPVTSALTASAAVGPGTYRDSISMAGDGSAEPKPHVFTLSIPRTILSISGVALEGVSAPIGGRLQMSGIGTTTLKAEYWPASLHAYSGYAKCTIVI